MDARIFTMKIMKINKKAEELIGETTLCQFQFEQWRKQRVETIQVIDDFQKKVEKMHLASNVAKSTGAAVSFVGALASLTGVALALTGYKTASKWFRNGNIAQILGSITSTSATFAQFGLTRNVESDIKRVLEKDMELSRGISEWIESSVTLDSLTKEIFGYGFESNLLSDVLKICNETAKLVNEASSTWIEITETVKKQLMYSNFSEVPDRILEIALPIAKRIYQNRRLVEPLRRICDVLLNNPKLGEMALLGLKLHCQMHSMFKSGLIPNIFSTFGLSFALFGSDITRGTCYIAGIALNAVSVIFAGQNTQNNTEYSEKLKDLLYLLKKELTDLDAEFGQIRNKRPSILAF